MHSPHGIIQLLHGWSNFKPDASSNPEEPSVSIPSDDDIKKLAVNRALRPRSVRLATWTLLKQLASPHSQSITVYFSFFSLSSFIMVGPSRNFNWTCNFTWMRDGKEVRWHFQNVKFQVQKKFQATDLVYLLQKSDMRPVPVFSDYFVPLLIPASHYCIYISSSKPLQIYTLLFGGGYFNTCLLVQIPGIFCVRGMFKIFVGKNCRICQIYWCFRQSICSKTRQRDLRNCAQYPKRDLSKGDTVWWAQQNFMFLGGSTRHQKMGMRVSRPDPRPEGRGPRRFFDFSGWELTFFRNSLQGEGREWEKETQCGKGLGSWDTW